MADETPEDTQPESGTEFAEPMSDDEAPAKLKQSVEMRDIGPCKKHIKVSVDRADIDDRLNKKYSELVVDASVPGFRPGKAPRKVIERRFHKDVFDQVKGEVVLMSLEQLAEENDVAPLSAPDLDPSKIEIPKDGPLVYEFEVEVRPQFDLPDYKGMKLRRPVRAFTEQDVANEEKRILAPFGQLVPKTDGGAEVGDNLVADITSRLGNRVLSNLKAISLRVESSLAFKDGVAERFGEQVRGARPGETRVVDIKLSSDSVSVPELRGQDVQATLAIKDVQAQVLPELTHEFLHRFGAHSVEQFRERLRVLLQRRLEYTQRQSAREQVLTIIEATANWDLPTDLLHRQARKTLARRVMEMRSSGMSEEEIVGRQRLLQQDVLRSTALALKEHFVLQKIAEVEKIDVDEDDINDEIERIASQNNESPRRVRARFEKEDLLDALAIEIVERKALDLVLNSAEYTDEPIGPQEEKAVSTVEEQAVPGEMKDPTAVPPPPPEEETPQATQS